MKIQDLKCSMIYIPRSTKSTWELQELEQSSSYLDDDAELDSWVSMLGNAKQMLNDDEEDEWMQGFSSTVLEHDEISNCHVNIQASTATILQEFSKIWLQFTSIIPADDD